MESSWRNNVQALGWYLGPYRLIARYPPVPGVGEYFLAQFKIDPTTAVVLGRVIGSGDIPLSTAILHSGGHFPHGEIVIGD